MKKKTMKQHERFYAVYDSPGIALNVWISSKRLLSTIQYDFILSKERECVPHLFQTAPVWLMINAPSTGRRNPPHGRIMFEDIVGNGHNSEYNNIGAGTLLVNTAINVLKGAYHGDTPVNGTVSDVGDPDDKEGAVQSEARRRHFWSKFNFGFEGAGGEPLRINARLDELKAVDGPAVLGTIPRVLQRDDFVAIEPNSQ